MLVLTGRCDDPVADRDRTRQMARRVADSERPALRVWRPHKQVAFGRRDATSADYERATAIAREHGFAVLEREAGGRAVAYTGSTVAVAHAIPIADGRTGIQARYETTEDRLQAALETLGVDATAGEPPDSFCPGSHSLQARGKLVGIAQRVRQDVAVVGAVVLVNDHDAIATVLEPIYEALSVSFDPDSVGSIERAGGPADPEQVIESIVDAFLAVQSRPPRRIAVE